MRFLEKQRSLLLLLMSMLLLLLGSEVRGFTVRFLQQQPQTFPTTRLYSSSGKHQNHPHHSFSWHKSDDQLRTEHILKDEFLEQEFNEQDDDAEDMLFGHDETEIEGYVSLDDIVDELDQDMLRYQELLMEEDPTLFDD